MPATGDILEGCDYGLTTAHMEAVRDVLMTRERAVRDEAFALQKQAAAAQGERYVKRFGNQVSGYVDLSISPYLYHKLGQYYGYECWDDADFLRNVWKHYPETRVRNRNANPTVPVLRDLTPRKVKFSKNYGEDAQRGSRGLSPHPAEAACAA